MGIPFKLLSAESLPRQPLEQHLSAAHTRIETTFLDAGATLVAVMELVDNLLTTLERFTVTLDAEKADSTISGLERTVSVLAAFPALAGKRHETFDDIMRLCAAAFAHVEDMRETFRYLKVFATTVKITGAGIAEFAEFADEIRDRIVSGADEIGRFAVELEKMQAALTGARHISSDIVNDFSATVPKIAENLSANMQRMRAQHAEMAALATDVKRVAEGVQGKIASALSALQIGDITRQRIEHTQKSFELLDEYIASPEGMSLLPDERAGVEAAVCHLAFAQMDETVSDLREKCASIFATISSFSHDAARILEMRDVLAGSRSSANGSILAKMENDLAAAAGLVDRIENRGTQSATLATSIATAVQSLIRSIETVRLIKTDVNYMALNSNLRCSRLGDEGRSINVVSGELRNFADKLEKPAEDVVRSMHGIEAVAVSLDAGSDGDLAMLGAPLAEARGAISGISEELDRSLADIAENGNAVFGKIAAAVRNLDFDAKLGDTLDACVTLAGNLAANSGSPAPVSMSGTLGDRIYAAYTMSQERNIHATIFAAPQVETATRDIVTDANDDDFLDDALF